MLTPATIRRCCSCSPLLSLTVRPGQRPAAAPAPQPARPQPRLEPGPPGARRAAARPRVKPGGAADGSRPVFRGGINFVRVDVIVDDKKDQPVTNLTQADFEVLEDGKPVSVEQFTLVKVDGNPRPGAPPPTEIRNRNDEELDRQSRGRARLRVLHGRLPRAARELDDGPRAADASSSRISCGRTTSSRSCIR